MSSSDYKFTHMAVLNHSSLICNLIYDGGMHIIKWLNPFSMYSNIFRFLGTGNLLHVIQLYPVFI